MGRAHRKMEAEEPSRKKKADMGTTETDSTAKAGIETAETGSTAKAGIGTTETDSTAKADMETTETGSTLKAEEDTESMAAAETEESSSAADVETDVERISVRSLVEFILRSGDIDNRISGTPDREAMQLGSRLHRKIQGRMGPEYRSEVSLKQEFPCDDFQIRVEGRADGIYEEAYTSVMDKALPDPWNHTADSEVSADGPAAADSEASADGPAAADSEASADGPAAADNEVPAAGPTAADNELPINGTAAADHAGIDKTAAPPAQIAMVDEIKGVMRDVRHMREAVPVHLAQAKTYAYIYALQEELSFIGVRMSYGNLETEEMRYFYYIYTFEELSAWFGGVIEEYRKWARFQRQWHTLRQASIQQVKFPFAYREGQKQLAGDVYRTIQREKILFVQAPTGVGKTISTVFPAVMAVGQGLGDKLFYLTAKTIARTVAEEAFALLRKQGLQYKTVTLTAKEKICPLDTPECNPESCPYAKGHFDRINQAIYELITTRDPFDRQTIAEAAKSSCVCPFELQLDLTLWADAVIGDYNYVFDPRAKLRRFFGDGVKGDYLFLIDEAHNLVDRGRDMYSASLCKEDFLALKRELGSSAPRLARALSRCSRKMLELKRECTGEYRVLTSLGTCEVTFTGLYGIMNEWLEDEDSPRRGPLREKVLELYFAVGTFLETCDVLDEHYVIYTQLLEDGRFLLRLYCVDPSARLQECLDKARSTIAFSATFLPIRYYKSLLSTREDNYAVYARSCFDPQRCQVLIGRDTSSLYRRRSPEQYRLMAAYIHRTARARHGNYLVFFSSYRMLEDVAAAYREIMSGEMDLICQEPGMREADRELFLEEFSAGRAKPLVGFCVMGSIFGEGIDLKEDRLIGTIIVGCGLPQVCPEVRILQEYYDERGMDGFRYAYQYPGMNKVLQAAGRVIRTENDRGVIILLDERFMRAEYREMFPREWERVKALTLPRLEEELETFWKE